jgi:YihY family inner membrane protein
MLAVFPFVLLVLFIFGQIVRVEGIDEGLLLDLQRLFPEVEHVTLRNALERIEENSTTIGIVALAASLWIGASFWGAMDTAFCRIYHVECRGWVEQKRFSFLMLFVVLAFIGASVFLPAVEAALIGSTDNLPFGLGGVRALDNVLLLAGALGLTFLICCVIYWAVPKGHMPWRDVWLGAAFVTVATGVANWLFPLYLNEVSSLSRFGTTVGFILITLIWFYFLSLSILAGAVINSLRHELHDTGRLPLE